MNRIKKLAFQWKMLFNCDLYANHRDTFFSHKRDNENYPSSVVNDTKEQLAPSQKYLGLVLDFKLNFNEHIDNKINKCNKILGTMKIFSLTLWKKAC